MVNPELKRSGLIFSIFYDIIYVYEKVGEILAHQVTCVYCKEVFDRDVIPYIISGYRRYGHASCYNRQRELDKEKRILDIIDPSSIVECCYCKEHLNKNTDDWVPIRVSLVAHRKCAEEEKARHKTDQEKLEDYICDLFGFDYVPPKIKKQITQYTTQYNYTYTGIMQSLHYFYKIKGNDTKKANDGIGIVPYVFNDAFNYFYDLWKAQNTNRDKVISEYVPEVVEVTIPIPVKENKMKKLFSFLDKDEIDVN